MKRDKTELLESAYNYCNEYDKSTEYMIEFMQDFANASFDEVIEFVKNKITNPYEHRTRSKAQR